MRITKKQLRAIVRETILEVDKRTKERKYKSKTTGKTKEYEASAGSIAAIKKHKGSVKKAVEAGEFDWADEPYAAANAAKIVAYGKPSSVE